MQVGLATETLGDDDAFQSVSHEFTVFSILEPLAAARIIFVAFCYRFVNNWVEAAAYRTKSFRRIQTKSKEPRLTKAKAKKKKKIFTAANLCTVRG